MLACLGDAAADAQRYDDAITQYSAAMSLNPESRHGLFVKRSKARMAKGLWEDALNDVNEVCLVVPYKLLHVETESSGDLD